ncbi:MULTISPECIES: TonB family protein [unclassified Bradyrhizobium]
MAMNAFALHDVTDQAALRRWGISALVILATHAALIAAGMKWYREQPLPGVSLPAIMVDMAPATSAPQSTPLDLAPGPEMQAADASPPEPVPQQAVEELIPPTPPQEKPEVVAPPEQKLQPAPPAPEPAKPVPDRKPTPAKPKVVRPDAKKPTEAPPAPRTTASPRVERQGPTMSAVSSGASAAAVASYNQIVRAHLLRFKQYPPGAKSAGQQGIASVVFTLSRGGQVTSSRLGRSSGNPALDAEVVAMVRRAQPFPPFPSDMKHPAMGFNVPISFSLR